MFYIIVTMSSRLNLHLVGCVIFYGLCRLEGGPFLMQLIHNIFPCTKGVESVWLSEAACWVASYLKLR